ncbi:penicillin-binding protein, partial [Streptomyces ochraceiscleroticus]
PGPIWRDAMAGALAGKPAPGFHTVPIRDPKAKKKNRAKPPSRTDDKPGGGGIDLPDLPDVIGGGGGDGGWNWPGGGNGRGHGG